MKCFQELACPVLDDIQCQSLEYLYGLYDFNNQSSLETDLWLKIDTREFLKNSPALINWCRDMKLMIRETALTVINDHDGVGLHIDELPVTAKINIPLLNYRGAVNEWWHVPDHVMATVTPKINQFGNPYYDLSRIDLSLCSLEDSVEMTGPIVFNSQKPHRVVVKEQAVFPRVILACMFHKEPLYLLD